MPYQWETLPRKSSVPWNRLRPAKHDPLDSHGFVSRGDKGLLDPKIQESYYHIITARYMQFCTRNRDNLNQAFTSLLNDRLQPKNTEAASLSGKATTIKDNAKPSASATMTKSLGASKWAVQQSTSFTTEVAEELTAILIALRKLREGILGSSRTTAIPLFSQKVYVFNIQLAILARHPESYHAPLRYLLTRLHSHEHPIPQSDIQEMLSYLILDTALRLNQLNEAYLLRLQAKTTFGFRNRNVDLILKAVATDNWPLFWLQYKRVDGYVRAIMHWKLDALRTSVLKTIGRSYMKCDVEWILQNAAGGELSWEDLVSKEDIGWMKDGNTVTIRKPKVK